MLNNTMNKAVLRRAGWPLLGRIKLGEELDGRKLANHPYFVIPPELVAKVGEKPTRLDIVLPFPEVEQCFDNFRAAWRQNKTPRCMSRDGITATAYGTAEGDPQARWRTFDCLGDECPLAKDCKPTGILDFFLPVSGAIGLWRIQTRSVIAHEAILATLLRLKELTQGRPGGLAGIPVELKRVSVSINRDHYGNGNLARSTVHTLELNFNGKTLMAARRLPAIAAGEGAPLQLEAHHA